MPAQAAYHAAMRITSLLTVLLMTLIAAGPAMAQQVDLAPARSNEWVTFVVVIILLILASVGSFLSSRRGHQD